MIGIIDYGMGNLRSVQKALERLGAPAEIISSPTQLKDYEGVILPGVGAFRDAIAELRSKQFDVAIHDYLSEDRPLLGICLGMQLLFDRSYEDGDYEGLGVIPGEVVRFQSEPGLKIPHMGWNSLTYSTANPLMNGIDQGDYVYFVHSYFVKPVDPAAIVTQTQHGTQTFVSSVNSNSAYATQFHPEKSQQVGLKILSNFVDLVPIAT
ncbi:imidazole glycerol phosphate synthase subunit HisH [Planctomicrobium sp. SH668]|uniref:imidazole glycerol phosphate synthase subunit HisH n=1 Tax=Planctomicrobium sp. SH668 TaxID=3448126 RepID=UPI003F5B3580